MILKYFKIVLENYWHWIFAAIAFAILFGNAHALPSVGTVLTQEQLDAIDIEREQFEPRNVKFFWQGLDLVANYTIDTIAEESEDAGAKTYVVQKKIVEIKYSLLSYVSCRRKAVQPVCLKKINNFFQTTARAIHRQQVRQIKNWQTKIDYKSEIDFKNLKIK